MKPSPKSSRSINWENDPADKEVFDFVLGLLNEIMNAHICRDMRHETFSAAKIYIASMGQGQRNAARWLKNVWFENRQTFVADIFFQYVRKLIKINKKSKRRYKSMLPRDWAFRDSSAYYTPSGGLTDLGKLISDYGEQTGIENLCSILKTELQIRKISTN